MTVFFAPDPELYGTIETGDMSAGDLVYLCERLLGHDPRDALINVLHVVEADANHLIAGTKKVPAPLAVALLRCSHGLPIMKQVVKYCGEGKLVEMQQARDRYVALLNKPSSFSNDQDQIELFNHFIEHLANYMTMRLHWRPDTDRW
jgi:hypothetical protein